MIKVRISPTIANEYVSRDIYEFISARGGVHSITEDQARELLDDARHMVFDTDMTPAGIVRAYASLASKLMESLGVTA
jgi:hypothetical protein